MAILAKCFEESKKITTHPIDSLGGAWDGLKTSSKYSPPQVTGITIERLKEIGIKTSTPPPDFHIHQRLKTVYGARLKSIQEGKGIDFGTGEALAFGSLLLDGKHVRLSGQDVERGTFSHRHAVLHDQEDNHTYVPLNHIQAKQALLTISNSHLSEYGVLGFEVGYAQEDPNHLVLWEAQFGDFFNTAQVIIDQFISSGEDKWMRQNGIVLLLPHGYEGAGPEHSSARIERFLQQSNDHPDIIPEREQSRQIQLCNWQCVNLTTPANYFHALRRQILREFRKPLIVFTPKSLLRSKQASSSLEDMGPNTVFQPIIGEVDDSIVKNGKNVKKVIFCSGKFYYDLVNDRTAKKSNTVAIIRVEQLSPFPFHQFADEAKKFPNAQVIWAQEEPMNMGAYTYVKDRMITAYKQLVKKDINVKYIGRGPSASTAAGHMSGHVREHKALLEQVYNENTTS